MLRDAPLRARCGWSCRPTTSGRTSSRWCARCAARPDAAAPDHACWSWTTPPPTAPASSPTGSPHATRTCSVLHRPRKEGLGQAYLAGFRAGAARRRGAGVRDGRRLLPRSRPTCRAMIEAAPRRRPGARLALRPGRRQSATGAGCAAWSAAAAAGTRARVLGVRRPGPDRRLQVLPARGAGGDRPRLGPLAGLRIPGGADLPRAPAGLPGRRRCRSCSRTGGSARARCRAGSCWRRCGWCRALRRQPCRRRRFTK